MLRGQNISTPPAGPYIRSCVLNFLPQGIVFQIFLKEWVMSDTKF